MYSSQMMREFKVTDLDRLFTAARTITRNKESILLKFICKI